MILLHLAVAALYVASAWALWPDAAPRQDAAARAVRLPLR